MTLGFIGTGTIACAIIRGLQTTGWSGPVLVSPRNAALAAQLAADVSFVEIAEDNQAIVDACDTIFLSVRPQVVEEVVSALRFRAGQHLVSLVATYYTDRLAALLAPCPELSRAVPLPFVEQASGKTPVFPGSSPAADIFERLGGALLLEREDDLNTILAVSSTMGAFFQHQATLTDWLVGQGVDAGLARDYVGNLISGLAMSAEMRPELSFEALRDEFSTKGGTNEQVSRMLRESGSPAALAAALDAIMVRQRGG